MITRQRKVQNMLDPKILYLTVIVESDDDGYMARCPGIQGGFAEGDTIEEAIFNCIDVVKMIAAYRTERGETLGINEISLSPNMQLSLSIPVGIN